MPCSNGVLDALHIVTYVPALHQALLDLSDWAERGIAPPANTKYEVVDGQAASSRKGDNEDLYTQVVNLCRVRVVVY
jgi:hypothetical protein